MSTLYACDMCILYAYIVYTRPISIENVPLIKLKGEI